MTSDVGVDGARRYGAPVRKQGPAAAQNAGTEQARERHRTADRVTDEDSSKSSAKHRRGPSPERRFARSLQQDPRGGLASDRAQLKRLLEKNHGKTFSTDAPKKEGLAKIEATIDALTKPPGEQSAKALDNIKDLLRQRPGHASKILEDMADNLETVGPGTGPFGDPANRKVLFREVVQKLAHPDEIFQGGGTADCGPAVVQSILAKASPRRYWAMARDLMLEGKFRLGAEGVPIKGDPRSIPFPGDPETSRTSLDTLIQESLFKYAKNEIPKDGPRFGGTGGETQAQANPLRPSGSRDRGRNGSRSGLYGGDDANGLSVGQIKGLLNTVLTDGNWKDFNLDKKSPKERLGLWAALKKRLKPEKNSLEGATKIDPEHLGVPVGVYTKSGDFHEVLVKRVRRGVVYYFDPATKDTERMKERDFLASVSQMLLPKNQPIDLREFDFKPGGRPPSRPTSG